MKRDKYAGAVAAMEAALPEIQDRIDKTGRIRFSGSDQVEYAYFASHHRVYGNSLVLNRLGYEWDPCTRDMVRYSNGEVSRISCEHIAGQDLWLLSGNFFFTIEKWPKYYVDNGLIEYYGSC